MSNSIPHAFRPDADGFDISPFHALLQRLRDPENGCPWDREQTLPKIATPLLNEAHEAAEALAGDNYAHMCEELGDVFLNLMLATVIAEENNLFTWRDVIEGVSAKMIRRHPHVFAGQTAANPEEALQLFLAAKAQEKQHKP